MNKKKETDYLLAGLFFATMAGVIYYVSKKYSTGFPDFGGQRMSSKLSKDPDSALSDLSEKIESVIEDGEQKIHKQDTRFSMPAGELGLFL